MLGRNVRPNQITCLAMRHHYPVKGTDSPPRKDFTGYSAVAPGSLWDTFLLPWERNTQGLLISCLLKLFTIPCGDSGTSRKALLTSVGLTNAWTIFIWRLSLWGPLEADISAQAFQLGHMLGIWLTSEWDHRSRNAGPGQGMGGGNPPQPCVMRMNSRGCRSWVCGACVLGWIGQERERELARDKWWRRTWRNTESDLFWQCAGPQL